MQTSIFLCTAMCMIPSLFAHLDESRMAVHSLSTEDHPREQNRAAANQDKPVYSRRTIRHTHRGMIQALCKHGHIYSESVRHAMLKVDRKNYFSKTVVEPYRIKSRPIGFGSDISSAHIHAQMLELLKDKIKPGARILDIGSGSGYLTACLAYLAGPTGRVYGVEHVMELAEASIKNIDKGNSELLDQGRVQFVVWNGKHGYEREAPYDIIHVSPSYYTIPQKLLDQLVPGGRMVMPIGEPFKGQNLTIIDKLADGYTIVTTVVRTVRTNPLYRDRFQQKKYYTELRRKAQERYNRSMSGNLTRYSRKLHKVTYVFKSKDEEERHQAEQQQQQQQHNEGDNANDVQFDHSISGEMWQPNENKAERSQKHEQKQSQKQEQRTTSERLAETTAQPRSHTEWDSSDYEMRPTTQWRWRHYFTYKTNNWIDYDGGFDTKNPYNIDGVDHGIKLDHTQTIDYIYPDYRNMTHYPEHNELWGNCEEYKKWYNETYVGKNFTPKNTMGYRGELMADQLPTIKPLPPGLLKDMERDSFPDHLFPLSDYFQDPKDMTFPENMRSA